MSHRNGFPKPSASQRTLRRWKKRILIWSTPERKAKLAAFEKANGEIKFVLH